MKLRSAVIGLAFTFAGGGMCLFAATPAHAAAEPCPPGQPPGRPPGNPPGPPSGRPPAYPPGKCALRLSQSAAAAGESVTAAGDGYAAGSPVTIQLGSRTVATAQADSSGTFTQAFTIPLDTTPGSYEVAATGAAAGGGTETLGASLTVTPPAAGRAGSAAVVGGRTTAAAIDGLSRTGTSSTIPLTAGGIALVAIGGIAVAASRRRGSALPGQVPPGADAQH